MDEKADVLEFSRNLAKIDEASLLNKTGNDSAIECSGKNPVFRGEEYDTRTRKSIRRSFDLIKESPSRKLVHKTKSFSSYFLVNIDERMNFASARSFDESGTFLNNTDTNKELGFLPRYESSFPSERSKDATSLRNLELDEEEPDSCSWKKIQNGPALGIYLKFEDVSYKVQLKGKTNSNVEKYILQGVNGSVCTGEILALIGPSGSGKTTLLNLLSGRMKNHGGTITYNDQLYTKSLKRRIGFVLQDDIVFPHLTVKETLTYSALLRLPNTLSRDQKKERAMTVIYELGLERCQDTMIGGTSVRGVSGGERKRVCIGNEILINPSLLFLDEPTSCLDSTTALRIIQMLHNIARDGKTVVTTIHQPSSRLFSKFDKLILLSEGSSLYFGKASEAVQHFSSIGCSPLIAMNPAEFLIDLANGNMKDKSIPPELEDNFLSFDSKNRGLSPGVVHEYFLGAYESRAHKTGKIQFLNASKVERQNMYTNGNGKQRGATWSEQFSILFERGLKERRHEYLSSLRIIQVISTSIVIGLLWWQSDASSTKGIQDQAGLLFFISAFWTFFPLFTAIFTFPQEREILAKERSEDMYKLSAYLIARNTSDLPLDLLLPILFLVIVYFMAGLKLTFPAFSLTSITIFLSIIASQGLGLAIGAAFKDVKKATTLASFTVMTFMLSGGFFIKKVPRFISWIRYTSLNYHTYRLLLKIQYNCHKDSSGSAICDSPFIKAQRLDHGETEVGSVLIMIIGYRILVYILLRRMKLMNVTSSSS